METLGASVNFPNMSTAQILTELPRLSHADRREIVRRLIALEEEASILADADARADANFLLLDALEAEDDARQNQTGRNLDGRSRSGGQGAALSVVERLPGGR